MKKVIFLFAVITVLIASTHQLKAQEKITKGKLTFTASFPTTFGGLEILEFAGSTNKVPLNIYFQTRSVLIYDKNGKLVYTLRGYVDNINQNIEFDIFRAMYSLTYMSKQQCPCSDLSDINNLKGGRIELYMSYQPLTNQRRMDTGLEPIDGFVVSKGGAVQPSFTVKDKATGAVALNWTSPALSFSRAGDVSQYFVFASGPINF